MAIEWKREPNPPHRPGSEWNGTITASLGEWGVIHGWNNCGWEPGEWHIAWYPNGDPDDYDSPCAWAGGPYETAEEAQLAAVEGVTAMCRGVLAVLDTPKDPTQ
jgi:hypothetical protein